MLHKLEHKLNFIKDIPQEGEATLLKIIWLLEIHHFYKMSLEWKQAYVIITSRKLLYDITIAYVLKVSKSNSYITKKALFNKYYKYRAKYYYYLSPRDTIPQALPIHLTWLYKMPPYIIPRNPLKDKDLASRYIL